jgi:catechol 2,3-dioxygenase-like lactoylglutathione lyase family enzyme
MMIQVESIDHFVLTVKDIKRTVTFYQQSLGMEKVVFGEGRIALAFGCQKINLHPWGNEFEPKAEQVMPGSEDLCFIINQPVEQAKAALIEQGVEIVEGPVPRTGAIGKIESIYLRDPDGNLIELANYID